MIGTVAPWTELNKFHFIPGGGDGGGGRLEVQNKSVNQVDFLSVFF